MNKVKNFLGPRFSYLVMGLIGGVILTFQYTDPKFKMLEDDAIQNAKISFLRGCTQNNTLETCKQHPGYTDHEEIFQKVEDQLTQGVFEPSPLIPTPSNALRLSGEDQREIQKIMQGRYGNKFSI